jgi:Chitin recognition protein
MSLYPTPTTTYVALPSATGSEIVSSLTSTTTHTVSVAYLKTLRARSTVAAKQLPVQGVTKEVRAFIDDTTEPQPTVTDNFPFIPDPTTTPMPAIEHPPFPVSEDASCGALVAHSCPSSECCSLWGWCGDTMAYCGDGCQPVFGNCWNSVALAKKSVAKKRIRGGGRFAH